MTLNNKQVDDDDKGNENEKVCFTFLSIAAGLDYERLPCSTFPELSIIGIRGEASAIRLFDVNVRERTKQLTLF